MFIGTDHKHYLRSLGSDMYLNLFISGRSRSSRAPLLGDSRARNMLLLRAKSPETSPLQTEIYKSLIPHFYQ
jgi:hypothetical protein